jgi:hypothetical protein
MDRERRSERVDEFCYHPPGGFIGKREPQGILKTDECSIVLELGHEGKFVSQIKWLRSKPGFPEGDSRCRSHERPLVLTNLPAGPRPAIEPVQHYFRTEE